MSELTHFELAYRNEYLCNGFNATQAYLKLKPSVTVQTANVEGCRLLSNPKIKDAITKQIELRDIKSVANRDYLISQAHRIGITAENKEQLGVALKSVDQKARLNRLYDTEQPDLVNYQTLIQSLVVNISGKVEEKSDKQQVIEGEVVK